MTNEIVSYLEFCQREGVSLQKGMNYQIGDGYSVILMSVRPNAPYRDRFEDDGSTLVYEGHDIARRPGAPEPKKVDQPQYNPSGSLTENGKFHKAAQDYRNGLREPEIGKVYEKLRSGIWSYNGLFQLIDSWQEYDGHRNVFKIKLRAIDDNFIQSSAQEIEVERRRIIPTSVKLEVWKRDGSKCVVCGAKDELHFDPIIPFSKGGTSLKADNVQLLCARHNLEKRDKTDPDATVDMLPLSDYDEAGSIIWSPKQDRIVLVMTTGEDRDDSLFTIGQVKLSDLSKQIIIRNDKRWLDPEEWISENVILVKERGEGYYYLDLVTKEFTPGPTSTL